MPVLSQPDQRGMRYFRIPIEMGESRRSILRDYFSRHSSGQQQNGSKSTR